MSVTVIGFPNTVIFDVTCDLCVSLFLGLISGSLWTISHVHLFTLS